MPEKKSILTSFHTFAFLTSLIWSSGYSVSRVVLRTMTPNQMSFLRCLTASVTMIIIMIVLKLPRPRLKDIPLLAVSGVVGFGLYMIFFNKGCSTVTSATGNVVLAASPIVSAIAARFIFREKLKAIQWLAIVIAFIGVVILTAMSGGFTVNIGLLWLMIAMCFISTYNLLSRYLGRTYSSITITAYSILFGTLFLLLFSGGAFTVLASSSAGVKLSLLYLGVACSGIAYCSWAHAFSLAPDTSSVTNYMSINPFLGAVFGIIIAGDSIEPAAVCGGLIIILGLMMFNFGPRLVQKKGLAK